MSVFILESGCFRFSCTDVTTVVPPGRVGFQALYDALIADVSAVLCSDPGKPTQDVYVSFRGKNAISVASLADAIKKARDMLAQDMNRVWVKKPSEVNTTLKLQILDDSKLWIPTPKGGHEVIGFVMKDDGTRETPFECGYNAGAGGVFKGYLCYSYVVSPEYKVLP